MLNKGIEEFVNFYNIVFIFCLKYWLVMCLVFLFFIYFLCSFYKKNILFLYDICGVLGYMCVVNFNFLLWINYFLIKS